MQRLRTVTSLDVSAVAGHHAMPAALLFIFCHLTLLHSEWPKLYGVLAVLIVNGLKTLLHSEWPKLYAECKMVKEVWCGDINC